jgi:RHS repeat-associated protein
VITRSPEPISPVNLDIDFTYDVLGNRIMEVRDNGETETTRAFLYDREDVVVEFSDDDFTEVEKVYVHGPGIDEVLAVNIPDGEDIQTDHLFHDGLGSVTCYYEESAHWLDYKAFGQENTQSYSGIDFRYTGREFVSESDNDTELYYYRARYFRPDLGRFISKDPLGMIDGTNMFIYVQNNPVMWMDPGGENIIKCIKIALCITKPEINRECDDICSNVDYCIINDFDVAECKMDCVFRKCHSTLEEFTKICGECYVKMICKKMPKRVRF